MEDNFYTEVDTSQINVFTREKNFSGKSDMLLVTKLLTGIELNNSEYIINSCPVNKPKAGSVILFKCSDPEDKSYLYDQYFRFHSYGANKMESINLKKKYYQLSIPSHDSKRTYVNFYKFIYQFIQPINSKNPGVLIHYTGDEKLFAPHSHLNSKNEKIFCRTSKNTIDTIKKLTAEDFSKPTHIYENLIKENLKNCVPEELHSIATPRNVQQINNFKYNITSQNKLTKCEVFSIYEMAKQDLGKFILKLELIPNYIVIFSDPTLLEIGKKLIKYCNKNPELEQLLSYDTTFNLGDFFLSVLTMKNTSYIENPLFPVAYMIHENKHQVIHEIFWKTIITEMDLEDHLKNIPIATDAEISIINSIKKIFPSANLLRCSNHLRQDVIRWVNGALGKTTTDIKILTQQITSLLESESLKDYTKLLYEYRLKWSQAFLKYYELNIMEDLEQSAKFNLNKFAIFKNILATNNNSESMNYIIKHRIDWKELKSDVLVIKLIELQASKLNEFYRASNGLGLYTLQKKHKQIFFELPHYTCYNTNDFVNEFKQNIEEENENFDSKNYLLTKFELAQKYFKLNSYKEVKELGIFVVKSPYNNKKYIVEEIETKKISKVKNFKCSCPSKNICHHILCIKMHFGENSLEKYSPVYNLSVLKKNTRACKKRLGRKRPNPEDLINNVVEASDSLLAKKKIFSLSDSESDEIKNSNLKEEYEMPDEDEEIKIDSYENNDMKKKTPNEFLTLENYTETDINRLYSKRTSLINNNWLEGSVLDDFVYKIIGESKNIFYISDMFYRTTAKSISQVFLRSIRYEAYKKDVILVCVSENNHWILGIIIYSLKKIYVIDSYAHRYINQNLSIRKNTFIRLINIAQAIYLGGDKNIIESEWRFVYAADAPVQLDSTECGVIFCIEVYCLLNGIEFRHIDNNCLQNNERNRLWVLTTIGNFIYYEPQISNKIGVKSDLILKYRPLEKLSREIECTKCFDEISAIMK